MGYDEKTALHDQRRAVQAGSSLRSKNSSLQNCKAAGLLPPDHLQRNSAGKVRPYWWDEERCSAGKGQQIHTYNQTAKGRPLKIGNGHRPAASHLEFHLAWEAWSGPRSSGTPGRTSRTIRPVLPAVVMDGNAAEVFPVHIPPGSGRFCPGTVGQTDRRYDPSAYGIWW